MSRYIVEYEVLHIQGQVVWSEMKAYPTIFTDKNIDEAKQIVNILSQIHSDCNIVKLEVSCEKTKDDVYHHMFDAFREKQGDCDRCVYNNQQSDSAEEEERVAREKKRAEEERVRELWVCANEFIDYLNAHQKEVRRSVTVGDGSDIVDAFAERDWEKLHRYYNKYID